MDDGVDCDQTASEDSTVRGSDVMPLTKGERGSCLRRRKKGLDVAELHVTKRRPAHARPLSQQHFPIHPSSRQHQLCQPIPIPSNGLISTNQPGKQLAPVSSTRIEECHLRFGNHHGFLRARPNDLNQDVSASSIWHIRHPAWNQSAGWYTSHCQDLSRDPHGSARCILWQQHLLASWERLHASEEYRCTGKPDCRS